ncbi:hypothetical protein [Streptomyces sp. NBC_00069]|uniref:hypothetical protein n=1 Tax=Streptomyces sp. NBC_00069 TaxID=2975639 RepID=UPI0032486B95
MRRTTVLDRRLRVSETEGRQRTLAEVGSEARTPPDARQELAVDTLVADVSDRNRITVRTLPSLRRVAEFTTAEPPTVLEGKPQPLQLGFLDDDQLFTVSGTLVEYWDARDGRALSQPIDLKSLRLTTKDRPTYFLRSDPRPGYVAVTVDGESEMHTIDLRTGKENEALGVRLGDGLIAAFPLQDPRYVAALTTGGMVELWSLQLDSGFFLANGSSVHFLKADDPGYRQTYQFAQDRGFLAATRDDEGHPRRARDEAARPRRHRTPQGRRGTARRRD